MWAGMIGWRLIHSDAFPFHRVIEIRWARWRKDSLVVTPRRWAWRRLFLKMVEHMSSFQPPKASTTRGTKSTPAERQCSAWAALFLFSATCRAWPATEEAPDNVNCCNGEITVTSRAVGWCLTQFGMKISAGRLQDPGIREGTSLRGQRAADWAAEKTTSQMALCRMMRLLLPPQPTWWSPKTSAGLRQSGQVNSSPNILRPSQYCRLTLNSLSAKCRPNVEEGMTCNQTPACGSDVDKMRALERSSGPEERRRLKHALSMDRDRGRWWIGISMDWRESQSIGCQGKVLNGVGEMDRRRRRPENSRNERLSFS